MMDRVVYASIINASCISVARTAWVTLGFLRTLLRPRTSVEIEWDWALFLVAPEAPLLAIAAVWLFFFDGAAPPYSETRLLVGPAGGVLALSGLGLTVWSWISLPSVGTGHYLLEGQRLVTSGAYGVVRHPIYTGAFLIWLGLASAYTSPAVFTATFLYVIPAYLLYIRGEERMMLSHYGDDYREYQRRVGALIPHVR